MSVALNGILKGLIAKNVQSHYVEATPSPLIGGGYTPSHVPWFTGVKRELKQRRQSEVKSFPFWEAFTLSLCIFMYMKLSKTEYAYLSNFRLPRTAIK